MSSEQHVAALYQLLDRLESAPEQGLRLADLGRRTLPTRGVYFFMEPGESRTSPHGAPRVVRVGTHAVSDNAKSTLWQRMRNHMGARAGGGNHRGSIFRRHVGAALLAREGHAVATWGIGSTAPPELRQNASAKELELAWEQEVSKVIAAMTVFWIDVPDVPSSTSERAVIERNCIALLSNKRDPVHPPSAHWLGRHSDRPEVVQSGLWNLNHVDQAYDPAFLPLFEAAVERTLRSA